MLLDYLITWNSGVYISEIEEEEEELALKSKYKNDKGEERRFDILTLPSDVAMEIFKHISIEHLSSVSRVCKRWNHIIHSSDVFWMGYAKRLNLLIQTNSKQGIKNQVKDLIIKERELARFKESDLNKKLEKEIDYVDDWEFACAVSTVYQIKLIYFFKLNF